MTQAQAPQLDDLQIDRKARRRRMIVMPVLVLIAAGVSWWWGSQQDALHRDQLTAAVNTLTRDTLEGAAAAPEGIRLRWADDSLRSVFRKALSTTVGKGAWQVRLPKAQPDAPAAYLVTISGLDGQVHLTIKPLSDTAIALVSAVETDSPR